MNVTIAGEIWGLSPAACAEKGAARRAASIAKVAMLCVVPMSRSPWYVRPHCGVYVDTVTAEPPLQSTAAAARRLAGAGLGREEAGEGRTDHWHHRPGHHHPNTTTGTDQNWCTLYYGHWSSPCRHPALWPDQEPRHSVFTMCGDGEKVLGSSELLPGVVTGCLRCYAVV